MKPVDALIELFDRVGANQGAAVLVTTNCVNGLWKRRVAFLRKFTTLSPTPAERFEALEQLRALGHRPRIAVAFWSEPVEAGVDTPEDLARVRKVLGRDPG